MTARGSIATMLSQGSTGARRAEPGSPDVELPLPLLALLREDYDANLRDWTRPGFRALAIHRFGVWRLGVQPTILRAPLSILYRSLFRFARNRYGIELPYSAQIGRRVKIEHQSGIVIHGSAVIGDDCIIRQGVTIGNRRDDRPLEAPRLGDRVNLGAGATVLGGIVIGDDVRIGAQAVVLDDVPAGSTVLGPKATVYPPSGADADRRLTDHAARG